jgi:hypothetical protein
MDWIDGIPLLTILGIFTWLVGDLIIQYIMANRL